MTQPGGTIFFDASCGICSAGERGLGSWAQRLGYRPVPLQSDHARQILGIQPGEIPDEIKLLTPDGQVLGGVDALLHLLSRLWWGKPLAWLVSLPGGRRLLQFIYRRIADNRYAISRACRLRPLLKERSCPTHADSSSLGTRS